MIGGGPEKTINDDVYAGDAGRASGEILENSRRPFLGLDEIIA
jgi:hypothetical protein